MEWKHCRKVFRKWRSSVHCPWTLGDDRPAVGWRLRTHCAQENIGRPACYFFHYSISEIHSWDVSIKAYLRCRVRLWSWIGGKERKVTCWVTHLPWLMYQLRHALCQEWFWNSKKKEELIPAIFDCSATVLAHRLLATRLSFWKSMEISSSAELQVTHLFSTQILLKN